VAVRGQPWPADKGPLAVKIPKAERARGFGVQHNGKGKMKRAHGCAHHRRGRGAAARF
jgi:hypothetical protein